MVIIKTSRQHCEVISSSQWGIRLVHLPFGFAVFFSRSEPVPCAGSLRLRASFSTCGIPARQCHHLRKRKDRRNTPPQRRSPTVCGRSLQVLHHSTSNCHAGTSLRTRWKVAPQKMLQKQCEISKYIKHVVSWLLIKHVVSCLLIPLTGVKVKSQYNQ